MKRIIIKEKEKINREAHLPRVFEAVDRHVPETAGDDGHQHVVIIQLLAVLQKDI
jgi:hypothetical protein